MRGCKGFDVNRCVNAVGTWPIIPYAGDNNLPIPEEPTAGQWSTFFLDRNKNGKFTDKEGNIIRFRIRRPDMNVDFRGKQLSIVKQTLEDITNKQITIAKYWGHGVATKQWTPIIDRLIDTYNVTAPRAGRILAATQGALNDAFVVAWYYKFLWNIARPNQLDQSLVTVECTPSHPSYPSGHATIAGCAQVVLSYFFKGETAHLKKLAKECAVSRLYAGVHYPIDNSEGLRLGEHIGEIIVGELAKEHTIDGKPIDKPFIRNLNAKLPPPPYKQVIPFNRKMECSSYTISNI